MTQEKLEQRAEIFMGELLGRILLYKHGSTHDRMIGTKLLIEAIRTELQKAAEIALEQDEGDCTECRGCGTVIAAKIRKLME